MNNEVIVCIPGTWETHKDFLTAIITASRGEFMCAVGILAHPKGNDHVEIELYEPYDQMAEAFRHAGQGQLSDETLNQVAQHKSAVYLHFPLDITSQRLRLLKFTEAIYRSGGIAVKLDSSGIAHEWERWFSLLRSDNPFDLYCASVVLIRDVRHYHSCGMHHFGLPDSQISSRFDSQEGADLLNQFNYYQIVEKPNLESGHTFSLAANSPYFRIHLLADTRHPEDDLFYNPYGVWDLSRI